LFRGPGLVKEAGDLDRLTGLPSCRHQPADCLQVKRGRPGNKAGAATKNPARASR